MSCFSAAENLIIRASICGGLKLALMGKSTSYLHVPRYVYEMCVSTVHFGWNKLHAPIPPKSGSPISAAVMWVAKWKVEGHRIDPTN